MFGQPSRYKTPSGPSETHDLSYSTRLSVRIWADSAINAFASGREFAAFLGLTPRQNSSGGKDRLGRITKMGGRYLRKLLVAGSCSVLFRGKGHNDALRRWADQLIAKKPGASGFKLVAVALANKLARIVFALLTRGGDYDDRPVEV